MTDHAEPWGGWDRNVYDSPEKCGMRLLGALEDANASYSFDTVIVVQDAETGAVYAAHDSGCSCPTPFEDVHGIGDLTEIRSVADAQAFVKAHSNKWVEWPLGERRALYGRVREALSS